MRPRDRRFVAEYLRTADAAAEARAAGYAPSRAAYHALARLGDPEIRAAVARGREERAERTGLTRSRVLLEYARLAFADPSRLYAADAAGGLHLKPLLELSDGEAAAVAAVRFGADGAPVQVVLHRRTPALEALVRYFSIRDRAAFEDDSAGARERLIARLEALAAAEAEAEAEAAAPAC